MRKKSDVTGRAFEAIVLEYLISELNSNNIPASYNETTLVLHENAIKSFNEVAVNPLYKENHLDFINNSSKLTKWIIDSFDFKNSNHTIIRKFKDSEANDNVADIQLTLLFSQSSEEVNFSLKNNHNALKHSRINPIPSWFGYKRTDGPYLNYTNSIKKAGQEVLKEIYTLIPTSPEKVIKYSDIDNISSLNLTSKKYKKENVFPPFLKEIENFILHEARNDSDVAKLWKTFISEPHYKIVNTKKEFKIYHFDNIQIPTSFKTTICKNGYLHLLFNNDHTIIIRLHNDSSDVTKQNFKCDVQLDGNHLTKKLIHTILK